MSQSNHLVRVWKPGPFTELEREAIEELKSKDRTEKERQWGSKVKGRERW